MLNLIDLYKTIFLNIIPACIIVPWFIYLFSSKLNIASNEPMVNKLTLISSLTDRLVLDDNVCESSTSSNQINLLNSLKNIVYIVFL